MTPEDYVALICSGRAEAVSVPFVKVSIDEWIPKISDCHNNVDRWVAAYPDCEAVRGWISYISFGQVGEQLTAHSIVRNPDGTLIDITPVCQGAPRGGAFIEHRGDMALFAALKDHDIRCASLDPEADAAALDALIADADDFEPINDTDELG
jgi:hypothetical protein